MHQIQLKPVIFRGAQKIKYSEVRLETHNRQKQSR